MSGPVANNLALIRRSKGDSTLSGHYGEPSRSTLRFGMEIQGSLTFQRVGARASYAPGLVILNLLISLGVQIIMSGSSILLDQSSLMQHIFLHRV